MKRVLLLVLSFVVFASMLGVTVHAAMGLGDDSSSVKASYESGTSDVVYSVDITWQGMTFIYNGADAPVWDPVNHVYGQSADGSWASSNATVTVTNHSNSAVFATFEYDPIVNTAMVAFDTDTLVVGSAEVNARAESGTVRVTPGGYLTSTTTDGKIGNITVTIGAALDIRNQTASAAADAMIAYIDANKDANGEVILPIVAAPELNAADLSAVCDSLSAKYGVSVSVDLVLGNILSVETASLSNVSYNDWLRSLVLTDAETIKAEALSYSRRLKVVEMPKATVLGERMLAYCTMLEKIQFGAALESVAVTCFDHVETGTILEDTTLYLSPDQKLMTKTTVNGAVTWIPASESYWGSEDEANNRFCGYTFKDVVVYGGN